MDKNIFKESLKEPISNTNIKKIQTENITNKLLKQLNIFPLPENIEALVSDDLQYLNIKIKENNQNESTHLLFQFPLKENNYTELKKNPNYTDLINRYNLYTNNYIDEIKSYAQSERMFLEEKFPELIFNLKIRIKSFESYQKKLEEKAEKNENLYINDIMGERIIISSYKDSTDPKILEEMCYEVAKALYEFRINTNFRMKSEPTSINAASEKEYITKDYITNPKNNGYQSLHLLMQHMYNEDLTYETQIRTLDMENSSKKEEQQAHKTYKPRLLNDSSPNKIPNYVEISCFRDSTNTPIILDVPFHERFYHFYNSDRSSASESPAITYEKFREEQYIIQQALNLPFTELRRKLSEINLTKPEEKSL